MTALLGLAVPRVQARPVASWKPDSLAARATLVCNVTPLSINPAGAKEVRDTIHFQAAVARFKVIGVSKGGLRVGAEIEVHYTALDFSAYPKGIGGLPPLKMWFEMGNRYRLYLNPAKGHSWYVGALDGELDDNFAKQWLEPEEGDESAPVFEAEAIQRAAAYYRKVDPSVDIDSENPERIEAKYDNFEQVWTVRFWARPRNAYPDFTSDAEIFVNGSRSIEEKKSWIAEGFPLSGKELTSRHIGASLRVLSDGFPRGEMNHGNDYLIWGNLTGLDVDEIRGHFLFPLERNLSIAAIPRKAILGVQLLKKPPSF